DATHMPAYLETSTEGNVAWYRHHGFELQHEVRPAAAGPPIWTMWREPRSGERSALPHGGDELLELAEGAALVRAGAVDPELGDDRIASVPVATGLGVEPVEMAGALLELLEHPVLRRVVVVARVAEQDDRRLGCHLLVVVLVEHLEGVPVVGVTVDPYDVG